MQMLLNKILINCNFTVGPYCPRGIFQQITESEAYKAVASVFNYIIDVIATLINYLRSWRWQYTINVAPPM